MRAFTTSNHRICHNCILTDRTTVDGGVFTTMSRESIRLSTLTLAKIIIRVAMILFYYQVRRARWFWCCTCIMYWYFIRIFCWIGDVVDRCLQWKWRVVCFAVCSRLAKKSGDDLATWRGPVTTLSPRHPRPPAAGGIINTPPPTSLTEYRKW